MPSDERTSMVLRSIYLPVELDDDLRGIAFRNRRSKGDLIREFVADGLERMAAADNKREPEPRRGLAELLTGAIAHAFRDAVSKEVNITDLSHFTIGDIGQIARKAGAAAARTVTSGDAVRVLARYGVKSGAGKESRVSEYPARVEAQREQLTSQLNELEATERVLARYTKGSQARRTSAAKTPTTAAKAVAPARSGRRARISTAKSAKGRRTSPSLGDQVLALATGKTQQEIAAACRGARPNHVGVVIARHKRAGRIEERDGKLYAASAARNTSPAARGGARAN
jgi:hypothetical protein